MNKKGIRWLYRELPELVTKGILAPESAERLRQYYSSIKGKSGRRIALIVFSMLGALLIGAGIILLLAHNWSNLSRPVRTIFALAPLILAQLLAGWTICCQKESVAWREGTATFLTLMIGASIALVGQTYHVPGDMGNFLLTWMLLSVPLVYLLGASLPVILYLAGITAWAGYAQSMGGHAILFWPMAALIVPYFVQSAKKGRYTIRTIILAWAIALCLCVATGVVLEKVLPGLWIVIYASLFAVLYFTGGHWFDEAPTIGQRPFYSVGAGGIFVLSLLLTYKWFWREIGWDYYRAGGRFHKFAAIPDYVLLAALLIGALCLLVTCVRRREGAKLLFGVLPILTVIGYVFAAGKNVIFPLILFNLYLFVLGVGTITNGLRKGRLSIVNAGMLILMVMIVARFFDTGMGFVIRGLAFIIIGIGFLTTNLVLVRRWGGAK